VTTSNMRAKQAAKKRFQFEPCEKMCDLQGYFLNAKHKKMT